MAVASKTDRGADNTDEGTTIDPVINNINRLQKKKKIISSTQTIDSRRQDPLVNTRALTRQAKTYELETFDKHALVIFNQYKVYGHKEPRYGTEKDVASLTRTFKNFRFEVTVHNNLKRRAIFTELKKFSEKDFTDYGCVAVAILTHGSDKGVLMAKDQKYNEADVINHFMDKTTLISKPKIFIIQACRGDGNSSGSLVQPSGKIVKDGDDLEANYILPSGSDLLILHSSYPGRVSYRVKEYGSWFIQKLCEKLDILSITQDLQSIFTEVKRDVAIDMGYVEYNMRTLKMDPAPNEIYLQMPVMTSTLIRKLYLEKFGVRDNSRFLGMRDFLRQFVAENPNDERAQAILDIANTYEDSVEFNTSKNKTYTFIRKYLADNAQGSSIYKPTSKSFTSLNICLTGIFIVATFVIVLRNVKNN